MPESITVDTSKMQEVGENVLATKQGNLLVIVIDTSVTIGNSSTGKYLGHGSTGGFAPLPGGLRGNIYIGKKL
jgi:hypothetical protein